MLVIHKGKEPNSLAQHRCQHNADYKNIPSETKSELKKSLLQEQGFLCCYCMASISENECKIDHFLSQKEHPKQQLNYNNLHAACVGNDNAPLKDKHCDSRKGDRRLSRSPSDTSRPINRDIRYLSTGEIQSTDAAFNDEISDKLSDDPKRRHYSVLNLNHPRLVSNRHSVFRAVQSALTRISGGATKSHVRELLANWTQAKEDGQLPEFCGVAIYYLEKKLKSTR